MPKTPDEVKQAITEKLLPLAKEQFNDNLLSVILYGSLIRGNFIPGVSDVNLLILLEKADALSLLGFSKKVYTLFGKYRITPHILSKDEFLNSADVFPLEYLDIKEHHNILSGKDYTEELQITKKNLRHQIEDSIRGKITSLRQVVLASRGREKTVSQYLKNWFGSQTALFRGILQLLDHQVPDSGDEAILDIIQSLLKFDSEPFRRIIEFRKGGDVDIKQALESIHDGLVILAEKVDGMEV
jgi:predicted nucleotidyltransferase